MLFETHALMTEIVILCKSDVKFSSKYDSSSSSSNNIMVWWNEKGKGKSWMAFFLVNRNENEHLRKGVDCLICAENKN